MRMPWDRYDKGAVEVLAGTVFSELYAHKARLVRPAKDDSFLALDEKKLKALVYRYHVSTNMVWLKNGADCDKFSLLCKADILRGAIEQRFPLAPVFGLVDFTPGPGRRHEQCFARTASGLYLFYEPQTQKWTEWLLGKDYDFEP